MSTFSSYAQLPGDILRRYFREIFAGALALALAVSEFGVDLPFDAISIPPQFKLAGLTLGGFAVLGSAAWSMWGDEKEPNWQYIHEVNKDDPSTPRVSKVTPQVVREMLVIGGRLRPIEGFDGHYKVRFWNHDVENPVAHVTWDQVPDDADIMGAKPSEIEEEVVGMRNEYESQVHKARYIQTHLPILVRKLDQKRLDAQNKALSGHLAPSMGDGTVDELLNNMLPEDILPDRFQARVEDIDPRGKSHFDRVSEAAEDQLKDAAEESEETDEPPTLDEPATGPVPGDD
ncbi:hypothetical protein [Haloarchaeobius sp. DYHT-AS-18]|uniref:hypothetical protein n=1 Tax=Haloarchaeobius sp. DYHT-AS-18 TaxID=3446117 RepID=UPI003EBC8CC2